MKDFTYHYLVALLYVLIDGKLPRIDYIQNIAFLSLSADSFILGKLGDAHVLAQLWQSLLDMFSLLPAEEFVVLEQLVRGSI